MATEETGLVVLDRHEALAVGRAPDVVLEEARRAATALKQVIDGKKKKVTFNGETYLENEDWLTVARFYGVTSRIRSAKYVEYGDGEDLVRGFEAVAEAYLVESDKVISTAESMCLNDEPNWARKPLFQIKSMAQTRASSRVLRQVFGWVVVLAGYRATPAEEMSEESQNNYGVQSPQRKFQAVPINGNGKGTKPVTAPQLARMFAIAGRKNVPEGDIKTFVSDSYRLDDLKQLTMAQYDEVVAWVEQQ